jgi:hypothetical protein
MVWFMNSPATGNAPQAVAQMAVNDCRGGAAEVVVGGDVVLVGGGEVDVVTVGSCVVVLGVLPVLVVEV